jgi:hypothetical protein
LVTVAALGIVLGLWHGQLAMQALFVFRQGEPLTSWFAIALGPGTTLMASVVAIFFRKMGGTWLIASGIASFIIFFAGEGGPSEHVGSFFLQISLPMILVGAGFLLLAKLAAKRQE